MWNELFAVPGIGRGSSRGFFYQDVLLSVQRPHPALARPERPSGGLKHVKT